MLQKATDDDIDIVYEWQTDPLTRKYFHNNSIPSYPEHCDWMMKTITSENVFMYIINHEKKRVGVIRLNIIDTKTALVSILIAPKEHGKGFASLALKSVLKMHKEYRFEASINIKNKASQNLFIKCGFVQVDDTKYVKDAISE